MPFLCPWNKILTPLAGLAESSGASLTSLVALVAPSLAHVITSHTEISLSLNLPCFLWPVEQHAVPAPKEVIAT